MYPDDHREETWVKTAAFFVVPFRPDARRCRFRTLAFGFACFVAGTSAAIPLSTNMSVADADATFVGEVEDNQAGFSVWIGGDVDGDGLDDLVDRRVKVLDDRVQVCPTAIEQPDQRRVDMPDLVRT